MAKAGDKSIPTPDRMPLQEAIKHFGSFEAVRPHLRDDSIPARHSGLYTLDGRPYQDANNGRIPAPWWDTAYHDTVTGFTHFTLRGETRTQGSLSPYYSLDPRTTKLGFRAGVVGNPDWLVPGASNEDPLAAVLGPDATAPDPSVTSSGSFVVLAIGVTLDRVAAEALHEKMGGPLPASGAKKPRLGPQARRALPILKKLYPPDGKVPDNVSTGVVRGKINKELAPDSENQGLGDASWDTVNRLLGRG